MIKPGIFSMLSGACSYYIKSFGLSLRRICSEYLAHAALHIFVLVFQQPHGRENFWGRGKAELPDVILEQMFLRAWTISNFRCSYSASCLCLSWRCSQYLNCEREGNNHCADIGKNKGEEKPLKYVQECIKIYSGLLHVVVSRTLI